MSPTPESSGRPRDAADEGGARAHRISLLALFVGVPVALAAGTVWQLAVGTADVGGDPKVTGGRALLYDLPVGVLTVGVALISFLYAARALHAGAAGAQLGLWLSAGGLLFMIVAAANELADQLAPDASNTLNNVAWLAGAAAIGAAALVVRRRCRPVGPPASMRSNQGAGTWMR